MLVSPEPEVFERVSGAGLSGLGVPTGLAEMDRVGIATSSWNRRNDAYTSRCYACSG